MRQPRSVPGVSLRSHGTYRRDEVLAGIGWADGTRKTRGQAAGVVYSEATNVDALLVTLHKEDKDFAPSTRYRDYPISADLFHWESQSRTRADSETGRRYRDSAASDWRILLFVRHKPDDSRGFTSPYLFLGRVRYVSHESEKPMRITWKLDVEMPLDFFSEVKIAAG